MYFVKLEAESIRNLSLSKTELNNQIIRPGQDITVSTVVANHSDRAINNQTASLFINGIRRSLKSFNIEAKETEKIELTASLADSGFVFIKLELEEDDILADNSQYLTVFVPVKIGVDFSRTSGSGNFLKTVIEESQNITPNYITSLNSSVKSDVTIGFINNSTDITRLHEAINDGANFILFPDNLINENQLNNFLSEFDLRKGSINTNAKVFFNKINYQHPVLENIFIKEDQSITSPTVYKYIRRDLSANEKSIISLSDGSPFLSEITLGKGKLLLFSVAPELSWSDFPVKGIFAPIILKSIFYLSAIDSRKDLSVAGTPLEFSTQNLSGNLQIQSPDKQEFVPLDKLLETKIYSYTSTGKAGFYKIYSNKKLFSAYSVNPDPLESIPEFWETEELIEHFNKDNIAAISLDADSGIADQINQIQFGSELCKHLILLAIILAIVEMFVARTSKKDLVTIQE